MVKVLTIDLWGTIVSGSSTKELIDYYLAKVLNVDLEEFKVRYNAVKSSFNFAQNTQENFWNIVLYELGKRDVDPFEFTTYVNSLYKRNYVPNYNNIEAIQELIMTAKHRGYKVRVLSNVGYLTSKQIKKLILNHEAFKGVFIVGSDMVGLAKPNERFYERALEHFGEKEWVHIGDSIDLDGVSSEYGAKFLKYNNYSDWEKFLNDIN